MSITIFDAKGKAIYTAEGATSMKEAVERAVRQGVSLAGANCSGANFFRADFSLANFSLANFYGADFSLANFTRANFYGADLSLANCSGAHFSRANFSRADFSLANFYGADFSLANFFRADFSGANFFGVEGILHVGPVDGWDMYAVRWDDGPRIKAGCRWFTVSKAREWWGKGGAPGNKPEHGPLMLAGLEALLALAKDHGWEMP